MTFFVNFPRLFVNPGLINPGDVTFATWWFLRGQLAYMSSISPRKEAISQKIELDGAHL